MTLLKFDELVTDGVYRLAQNSPSLHTFFLIIGAIPVYALPLLLLVLFFRARGADRRTAIKLFLGAVLAWQVISNYVGGYLYATHGFRDRPFAATGATELFFEQPEKAFPSDHASVLVVVTMLLYAYGHKKLGALFLLGTALTIIGRVGVGFHYFGDMVGGALVALVVYGIMRWLNRPLEKIFNRFRFLEVHE